ncbi:MAG: hypothetical protein ACTSUE_07660 [Promethearchaeota archaeon]
MSSNPLLQTSNLVDNYENARDAAAAEYYQNEQQNLDEQQDEATQFGNPPQEAVPKINKIDAWMFHRWAGNPNWAFNSVTLKREDTRQYPMTRADFFYTGLAGLFGGLLGFATAIYFIVYLFHVGVFNPGCSSVNGAVCNAPYGRCTEYGQCECLVPTFSGDACEVSGCPGYSEIDRTVCGNRGMCSPGMQFEDVLEECKWEHRTRENGFNPRYRNGWDHPDCIAAIDTRRELIEEAETVDDILLIPNITSVPECSCEPPFFGAECSPTNNACPTRLDNFICSGNGNTSVDFINNATTDGLGCQCLQLLNLLDPIYYSRFSDEFRFDIQTRYFRDFTKDYCGVPVFPDPSKPDSFFIFIDPGAEGDSYKCFCDEDHFGLICEFGKCPDVNDVICGGNGHPSFGIGVKQNTTTRENRGEVCMPQCLNTEAEDILYSSHNCEQGIRTQNCTTQASNQVPRFDENKLCSVLEQCPPDRPYRCSNGECTAEFTDIVSGGDTSFQLSNCAEGYTNGWIDVPYFESHVRSRVRCDMTIEEDVTRCLGSSETETSFASKITSEGFQFDFSVSPVTIQFDSPLVWFSMAVRANQSVIVSVENRGYDTISIGREDFDPDGDRYKRFVGTYENSFENIELTNFVADESVTSLMRLEEIEGYDNRYRIYPFNFHTAALVSVPRELEVFRLHQRVKNLYIVFDGIGSSNRLTVPTVELADITDIEYEVIVEDASDPFFSVETGTGSSLWKSSIGESTSREACLEESVLCKWIWNPSAKTMVSMDVGVFPFQLCYDTILNAFVVESSDATCATPFPDFTDGITLPYSTVKIIETEVLAESRIEIGDEFIAANDEWELQIIDFEPVYEITLRFEHVVQESSDNVTDGFAILDDMEWVTTRDLEKPCICEAASVGTNQSSINVRWLSQPEREVLAETFVQPNDFVVAPVELSGNPIVMRGVVQSASETTNTTQVAFKGVSAIQQVLTTTLAKITALEFVQGMEDYFSHLFPLRCPTGTQGYPGAYQNPNEISTCRCDYPLGTTLSDTSVTNCTCVDTTSFEFDCNCTDTLNISSVSRLLEDYSSKSCGCSISDKQFESDLAARLDEIDERCACFLDMYIPTLVPNLLNTTETGGSFVFNTQLNASDINSDLYYPRETHFDWMFLTVTNTTCPILLSVSGIDTRFSDTTQSIDFSVECMDDSSFVVLEYDPSYTFQDFEFVFDLGVGLFELDFAEMIWSPGGIPVDDVEAHYILEASSNSVDAHHVTNVNATYWESKMDYTERPVWIRYSYPKSHQITRVLLNLRTVGIPVLEQNNGSLAIELRVQGSMAESPTDNVADSEDWVTILDIASNVYKGYEYLLENVTHTGPWRHVRLVSLYPMSIREFVPFTDQACDCLDGVLGGISDMILDDIEEDLDPLVGERGTISLVSSNATSETFLKSTPNIYARVQERFTLLNPDPDAICSCLSTCSIRLSPDDEELTLVTNDGLCQEENYVAAQFGIEQQTTFPISAQETANDMMQVFFQDETIVDAFGVAFPFSNDTRPEITQVIVYYSQSESPGGVPDFSIIPTIQSVFGLWDSTASTNLSAEGYRFQFADDDLNRISASVPADVYPNTSIPTFTENEYTLQVRTLHVAYGTLIQDGHACPIGSDCADCGPSSCISVGNCAGLTCEPGEREQQFIDDIRDRENRTTNDYRIVSEFRESGIGVNITGLKIQRTSLNMTLLGCDGQVCTSDKPFRCEDNSCVYNPNECATVYDCPGNGCVQFDSNELFYQCACDEGFGGIACYSDICVPADPFDNAVDPFLWCRCGGPAPLTIQGPVSLLKTTQDVLGDEYLRQNRLYTPRINAADVRNDRIRSTHSTGVIYLRTVTLPGGRKIQTDCPYAHAGPFGQYLTLEDDVQVRSAATGVVLEWTSYPNREGGTTQYVWTDETTYDEFPFRCQNNGHCVADEPDCGPLDVIFPFCNNHGTCRADGTCDCESGFTTFIFTEVFTRAKTTTVLYDVSTDSTNPVLWGLDNTNWRDYSQHWCTARDCDVVDCSAPTGCLPGSPSLDFADEFVLCSKQSGFGGKCGATDSDCVRGNVTDPIPCSGKGITRKRDYREEYYCECGSPFSVTADITDVKLTTELVPNGFGGDLCDVYECDEQLASLHFSREDPETGGPYRDETGYALPGIWKGFCDVPIGPDPDEIGEWLACNPGLKRLERAEFTPCLIQGKTQCLASGECIPNGGEPLVYPCNNHGTGRKDGTCECVQDEIAGTGYTFDDERFSYEGCYKEITCPRSLSRNRPCNFIPACDEPEEWRDMPDVPYFNDQIETIVARLGHEISNQSIIREITDIAQIDKLREQAYVAVAQAVEDDLQGVDACICVYPNDNPLDPIGMRPYDPNGPVGPYLKSFNRPREIQIADASQVLASSRATADQIFEVLFESTMLTSATTIEGEEVPVAQENVEYVTYEWRYDQDPNALPTPANAIRIGDLGGDFFVEAIRLRFQTERTVYMKITNENDDVICEDNGDDYYITVRQGAPPGGRPGKPGTDWRWITMYCTPVYSNYNFRFNHPDQFEDGGVCSPDYTEACANWMRTTCAVVPNAIYNPPGSFETFRGCTSVCCIPSENFVITQSNSLNIKFYGTDDGSGSELFNTHINKLRIMGYKDEVLPTPPGLRAELLLEVGDDDAGINRECSDVRFFQDVLGFDGTYYVPRENNGSAQTPRNWDDASARCVETGGWFAPTRDFDGVDTFDFLGAACSSNTNAECWVHARDLVEIKNPPDTTYFKQECMDLGCYFKRPDLDFSYIWSSNNIPFYNLRPNTDLKLWSSVQQNLEYDWDAHFIGGSQPNFPVKTVAPWEWLFWTNPEECRIILWEHPKCDTEISGTGPAGATYVIASGGGSYSLFFEDDGPTSSGNRGFRENQFTSRDDWAFSSGSLVKTTLSSVAIYGPCEVRLSSSKKNNEWDYSFTTYRDNNAVLQYDNIKDNSNGNFYGIKNVRALNDGQRDGYCFENLATDPDFPHDNVEAINIYPMYRSELIRVTFGADRNYFQGRENPNPDKQPMYPEETMGWYDQGHMCMHVKIEALFQIHGYFDTSDPNAINCQGIGGPTKYGCITKINPPRLITDIERPLNFFDDMRGSDHSSKRVVQPYTTFFGTGDYIVNTFEYCDVSAHGAALWPECSECEVLRESDYRWDQNHFPTDGIQFADAIEEANEFPQPRVRVRAFDRHSGTDMSRRFLYELGNTENDQKVWRAYAKQSSSNIVSQGDYEQNFFLDYCVSTFANGTANVGICTDAKKFVCIREYTPFAVQSGRQCDVCITSVAIGGTPRANTTCFDEFPKAVEEDFPFDWEVWRAWRQGTLNIISRFLAYDYDSAREFIDTGTTAIAWAFGLQKRFWDLDFSDRPGRTSFGVDANAIDWVDMSISLNFPFTCPSQCSAETGTCRRRCAADIAYCDPDAPQYSGIEMDPNDIPTIFEPLPAGADPAFESTCGTNVNPTLYNRLDMFGMAQPLIDFEFEELAVVDDTGTIRLRANKENPEWYNTGKSSHYYVFDHEIVSTVAGLVRLECVTCGVVTLTIWISPLDVNYAYPTTKYEVGTEILDSPDGLNTFSFSVDLTEEDVGLVGGNEFPNVTYQIVGWDFSGLDKGGIVELFPIILGDPERAEACFEERGKRPWYEPPSSIDSGAPENVCIMSERDRIYYQASGVGQCFCDKPFGGRTCECPALRTPNGKKVCGGFGSKASKVKPPSNTPQLDPDVRDPEPYGEGGCFSYLDNDEEIALACKVRDQGRIIETTLQLPSPMDYKKITRFDQRPGDETYLVLEDIDEDDLPATQVGAINLCLDESASLASWISATEVEQYIGIRNYPVFVDMTKNDLVDDGNVDWVWDERGVVFVECEDEASCGSSFTTASCIFAESVEQMCRAINHNNLVYRYFHGTNKAWMTDGDPITGGMVTPGDFSLAWPSGQTDITLIIWVWVPADTDSMTNDPLAASGCTQVAGSNPTAVRFEYTCPDGSTGTTITRPGPESILATVIIELQVLTGSTRTPFYDYFSAL